MNNSATTQYLSFDSEQLGRLITNLYTLTGIRVNVLDTKGNKLYAHNNAKPFCELMNSDPEGHRRCLECDRLALEKCMSCESDAYDYRCHAGICEHILPIRYNGKPFAFLIFGQMLDESPLEEQWKNTEALLDWYGGDKNALRESFGEFRRVSSEENDAFAEIVAAFASYIQLDNISRGSECDETQLLAQYLDRHFMEQLSLSDIASALGMGMTKLCGLAKQLSGGKTVTQLITGRRVEAAKQLLRTTGLPISRVAEQVGFSDYNYFTRTFRSVTGSTPTQYRKQYREQN